MLTRDKFDEVFREYYHALNLYAFRFVRNTDIAEDLVEDVFYNLWKMHEEFMQEGSLKSYLFTAVYHKCLNHIKHEKLRTHLQESASAAHVDFLNYYLSEIPKFQESLLSRDLSNTIKSAIENLPDQCHRIFILSRKFNFKNREISDFLDISIKVVEKQISKALTILREQLKAKK